MAPRNESSAPAGGARVANIVLGVWLFLSAFVWQHSGASQTNSWILGVIIAVVAGIAMAQPAVRWVNALAAVWLFISTFVIPHVTTATMWHNAILAIAVFALTFIGAGPGERARTALPA